MKASAQQKADLISENEPLIIRLSNQWHVPKLEVDDLISEGYIAALAAIDKFDDTRGVKFSTFLHNVIVNHFRNLLRNASTQKRAVMQEVSLYSPIGIDEDGSELYLIDQLASTSNTEQEALNNIEYQNRIEGLYAACRTTSDIELVHSLIEGETLSKIATSCDETPVQLSNRLKKIRRRMK